MKKLNPIGRSLVLALTAFGVMGATSSQAMACGGDWAPVIFMPQAPEVDHRPEGVAWAEKDLEHGKLLSAAAKVIRMMPHVRTLDAKRSKLVARAQRTLAVAIARSGGSLAIGKELPDYVQGQWLGKSDADKKANLSWAVSTLRTVSETKKNDPAVQTEMAEAMAQLDGQKDDARKVLEDLAQRDLISSPEGYAALGKLRSQAGDEAGQKVAIERCEAMAGNGKAICGSATIAKS